MVTNMAPILIGTLNNMFNAIAPPKISAREVETEAKTANDRTDFEIQGFK